MQATIALLLTRWKNRRDNIFSSLFACSYFQELRGHILLVFVAFFSGKILDCPDSHSCLLFLLAEETPFHARELRLGEALVLDLRKG